MKKTPSKITTLVNITLSMDDYSHHIELEILDIQIKSDIRDLILNASNQSKKIAKLASQIAEINSILAEMLVHQHLNQRIMRVINNPNGVDHQIAQIAAALNQVTYHTYHTILTVPHEKKTNSTNYNLPF